MTNKDWTYNKPTEPGLYAYVGILECGCCIDYSGVFEIMGDKAYQNEREFDLDKLPSYTEYMSIPFPKHK